MKLVNSPNRLRKRFVHENLLHLALSLDLMDCYFYILFIYGNILYNCHRHLRRIMALYCTLQMLYFIRWYRPIKDNSKGVIGKGMREGGDTKYRGLCPNSFRRADLGNWIR